ncbi:hypothetical protein LOC67_23280 [Stieleria sp. JC731]|uniref:hypothetical protein n=1 Tax=Pirellulaceae TaxID=2691357 RepID=UPI001E4AEF8F|nr:hypothetical protein [Stieleria sp. JC731]MCC9603482.1 hypothetical protein [Stieleria sp. JC731]
MIEKFIQENQIFVGLALILGVGLLASIFSLGGFDGHSSSDWSGDCDGDFGDFD